MKRIGFFVFFGLWFFQAQAQTGDFIRQPYLETMAKVDTAVAPDRIYLFINLNEKDSRDKKSTEELEALMLKVLDSLNIDVKNDLSLLDYTSNFKKYFLNGRKILKSKKYYLLVHDVQTLEKVMTGLERVGISNVFIDKVEYSKSEQLLMTLRAKAVAKAKRIAEKMVEPLHQKIGKAIYITDVVIDNESIARALSGRVAGLSGGIRGVLSYDQRAEEEEILEFKKIKFAVAVNVIFVIT